MSKKFHFKTVRTCSFCDPSEKHGLEKVKDWTAIAKQFFFLRKRKLGFAGDERARQKTARTGHPVDEGKRRCANVPITTREHKDSLP